MARKARELSALEVNRLKSPGLHAVGGVAGLHLQVAASGARSWILRVMVGGKRRDMGLGGFPDVGLAGAREKAREARSTIERGSDPILVRKEARSSLAAAQASALTFEQAALKFIEAKSSEWKNAKHSQQWSNTLATYAYPQIGQVLVRDIQQQHVLTVLEPIWKKKTETASRVRGRVEAVLDWARVRGYREGDNPARWRGHLDKLLPAPGKIAKVAHHPAVPVDELPAVYAALCAKDGQGARALRLLILTAVRSGELRGAQWSEIDLARREWLIPAERMKMKKPHRVPLSTAAIELLKSQPRVAGSDLVFPSIKGKPLSDMALTELMRGMDSEAVPHGFRSTFRDWCAEHTNYPSELAEMALAHAIANKVEAAYRRGDQFDKRAELMEQWCAVCLGRRVPGRGKLRRVA
jgi:integrase